MEALTHAYTFNSFPQPSIICSPDVALRAMSGFAHHFRCHPIWRAAHGLEQTILALDGGFGADVQTQALGTAEVDELDDAVLHHHDVASLDVPGDNDVKLTAKL